MSKRIEFKTTIIDRCPKPKLGERFNYSIVILNHDGMTHYYGPYKSLNEVRKKRNILKDKFPYAVQIKIEFEKKVTNLYEKPKKKPKRKNRKAEGPAPRTDSSEGPGRKKFSKYYRRRKRLVCLAERRASPIDVRRRSTYWLLIPTYTILKYYQDQYKKHQKVEYWNLQVI